MGWMTKELWFDSHESYELFLFSRSSKPALGPTHPLIQCEPGALSLEIIAAGHQADHSHLSNANIQNEWNYTSTCMMPYAFMVQAHLHLLLLLSVESINLEKYLYRLDCRSIMYSQNSRIPYIEFSSRLHITQWCFGLEQEVNSQPRAFMATMQWDYFGLQAMSGRWWINKPTFVNQWYANMDHNVARDYGTL